MDEAGIIRVCDALSLNYGHVRSGDRGMNMSVECLLAVSRHADPHDANLSCSIGVVEGGPSPACCFSGNCRFHGSFLRLVRTALDLRERTPEHEMLLQEVEAAEALTLPFHIKRMNESVAALNNPPRALTEGRDVMDETLFAPFAGRVPAYAKHRGLTVESCRRWALGYDNERGYLVFPVRRRDGRLVGLVGRHVRERRHHNYRGFDKTKHLFGAQLLEAEKPVIVVEGCVDAIKTDQALRPDACVVAALGEGFSNSHAQTIASCHPPFVCIFTDGDAAGRSIASKIEYALHSRVPTKVMECPWGLDGKKLDPADLPPDYIRKLFDEARPILGRIRWTEPPPKVDRRYLVGRP